MPGMSTCSDCGYPTKYDVPIPNTPFSSLDSRFCPDKTQREAIRGVISDIDRDVASAEAHIARVRNTLTKLESSQSSLLKCRQKFDSFLAPIRRLPSDVIAEIFVACIRASVDVEKPKRLSLEVPPTSRVPWHWQLAQVCSHWRSIALSLPRLWSCISVESNSIAITDGPHWERVHRLVEMQLSRTRRAPLSITFIVKITDASVMRLLDLLAVHSEQWAHLHIMAPTAAVVRLGAVRDHLPVLRTVRVHLDDSVTDESLSSDEIELQSNTITHMLAVAPLLRQLSLTTWRPRLLSNFVAPWSQLTTYAATFGVAKHLDILRQATRLEDVILALSPEVDEDYIRGSDEDILALPDVRQLCLNTAETSDRNVGTVLSALHLPDLVYLSIDAGDGPRPVIDVDQFSITPVLISLLERSKCSLFELSVLNHILTEEEFVQLLRLMPEVEVVAVALDKISDTFHRQLTHRREETLPVAPRLISIKILSSSYDVNVCLDMVESRWWGPMGPESPLDVGQHFPVERLRNFSLDDPSATEPRRPSEAVLPRLKKLRGEQGLDLSISIHPNNPMAYYLSGEDVFGPNGIF